MLKTILNFSIFCLLANVNLKAQDSSKPSSWKSYYKDDKIEISYKYAECNLPSQGTHHQNVYFKVKNFSSADLLVRWETETVYDGKCTNCNSTASGRLKTFKIPSGKTLEGFCGEDSSPELKILSTMLNVKNVSTLDRFELKHIKVYSLN